jgi:hypothetical protein
MLTAMEMLSSIHLMAVRKMTSMREDQVFFQSSRILSHMLNSQKEPLKVLPRRLWVLLLVETKMIGLLENLEFHQSQLS